MLLAIDVGNTHTTCGLFSERSLLHTFRIETRPSRTADEHAVLLQQLVGLRGISREVVDEAILASVVPPVTEVLVEALRLAFGCDALIVGPGIKTGISVVSQSSREVGADRIVNAVAVHDVVPPERGAIVVLATHDLETIDGLVDRAVMLRDGRLVALAAGPGSLRERFRQAGR